ncbi:uncharacterized protein LOC110023218 [Phalaenopsis equestris]|uniref:uncharacterized protein LOC110023218 n=1 Tax=Phalaenopsis equestris TaxID=78828 RepID=UPI0009E2126C|nr:uncharacterized protein LOC110023218 [Phalaenopsis equestris]
MEVKVKEVVVYVRKYLLFSLKSAYKFTYRHPFVASFSFSLFLLYSCYPSLFAFLVSFFPVLFCTALLLGILLSYGEPNLPEIEEDDNINMNISSLKVQNSSDDFFAKKDESFTLGDFVDNRVGTEERISKDSAHYVDEERGIDFLASVEEQNKIMENLEFFMKEQSKSNRRTSEVADSVCEGVEGLMVKIKRPPLDDWLDSSLGSPWQPITIRDASSDSESDQAESSSPDASMTDILPMLDELSPLLDSETLHNDPKCADNSDSELSLHQESDDESVEKEDECKSEGKDEGNTVVTWTADDQKNVMDLGSSDLERNRRLESLIARRRARKNQIIIYEKDLIDLPGNETKMDGLSLFHRQIPPIFAPRGNPFDLLHDLDESEVMPPIPGSAPSVLLRRQNPFDFPCGSEDINNGLAGETSCQPEFELPSQKGYLFRRHESFVSRSVFPPSNLIHEKFGSSRLNPYVAAEKMDSEGNDHIDFHNQQSEETDTKSSFVDASDTVSSAVDGEDRKVPTEQETLLPPHHSNPTVQYSRFCGDDLVDSQSELGGDGHSVDPNASAGIDVSDIVKKTTEEIQFVQNHEVVDEKHDDLNLFSSLESTEKRLVEVVETQEQINSVSKGSIEFLQSSDFSSSHLICETVGVDNNQASVPIYDSSPSGSGNFLASISVSDEILVSTGGGNLHSVSTVESLVQEDAANAFEESMAFEVIESMVFEGSAKQNSTSNNGETVEFSTYMNLLDENISVSKEIDEDFADQAALLRRVPFSSPSSVDAANEPRLAFFGCSPPIEGEEKLQSMDFDKKTSFGTHLEEFRVNNSELEPILEENSEDFKFEEERMSLFQTNTTLACSGLQKPDRSDVDLSNVGQEVVSLHYQSKEAAQAEGNEGKPSKNPSHVSADDDLFTGLVMGECVDSMDFSNQFKMKSEADCTYNDDNSDSQDIIMSELRINQNATSRILNDFRSEHGDLNVEFKDLQIFDEHLLTELDAVGDFRVEELKSQEFLNEESQSDSWFVCSEKDSELRSANVVEMSENKPISANLTSPDEMDLVLLNQEELTDSGYWSSAMAPVEELTVYNPKLNVLKSYSPEELDSIFQQELSKESVVAPFSETITEKLVTESSVGLRSFDMEDQEIEAVIQEEVLLTLARQNAGDLSSALIKDGRDFDISISPHLDLQLNGDQSSLDGCKSDLTLVDACGFDSAETQFSEIKADHVESVISSTSSLILYPSVISEAETSPEFEIKADISSRGFEIENTDSQLLVLEAKSVEDIYSAFKNVNETVVNESTSPLLNPEPMANHPVDTIVESISPEAEKTSGLLVLEAKSAENINSAFKQAAEESLTKFSFRNHPNFEVMEPSSTGSENSSELFVLEERSAKDIQLAFQLVTEEVSSMLTSSLIDSELSKTNQDHEVVEELLLLEGKSSEDTDSAFEQTNVDLDKLTSQAYPASLVNLIDSEVVNLKSLKSPETQIDQELLVLDAKFVEDIDSGFKPSSEGGLLRSKDGSAEETSSTLKHVTEGLFDKFSSSDYPDAAGTSEVPHVISHGAENDSDILSLETKSSQNLSSVCEHEIEADPVQQSLPEFENFQPDHDAVIERPLNAVDRLELFSLESKSFDSEGESFLAADKHLELKVLEEKSTGNIQSPFSVAYAGVHGSSPSLPVDMEPREIHPSHEVEDNVCSEAEKNSEMLVIEAKALEDVQIEQSIIVPEAISVELTDPSSKTVNQEGSKGSTFLTEPLSQKTKSDDVSEQLVQEEKSEKDVDSTFSEVAFNEAITGEKGSSEDQINRRTEGEEASSEDPSSSAPLSVKIEKKKFEKSDPSSSSSSSSSSSESY